MSTDNPTPIEPVTETTESVTEVARRKFMRLKIELASVALFVLGLITAIDPSAVILILGPESRGWVMMVFGIALFLMRRYGTSDPERILPRKRH